VATVRVRFTGDRATSCALGTPDNAPREAEREQSVKYKKKKKKGKQTNKKAFFFSSERELKFVFVRQ